MSGSTRREGRAGGSSPSVDRTKSSVMGMDGATTEGAPKVAGRGDDTLKRGFHVTARIHDTGVAEKKGLIIMRHPMRNSTRSSSSDRESSRGPGGTARSLSTSKLTNRSTEEEPLDRRVEVGGATRRSLLARISRRRKEGAGILEEEGVAAEHKEEEGERVCFLLQMSSRLISKGGANLNPGKEHEIRATSSSGMACAQSTLPGTAPPRPAERRPAGSAPPLCRAWTWLPSLLARDPGTTGPGQWTPGNEIPQEGLLRRGLQFEEAALPSAT